MFRVLSVIGRRLNKLELTQKRFNKKKRRQDKERQTYVNLAPAEAALKHFDLYYKPIYEEKWPSIRCSLLSQQKYCALVNNFANADDVVTELQSTGCLNFLDDIRDVDYDEITKRVLEKKPEPELIEPVKKEHIATDGSDLLEFMPVTRVLSEKDEMEKQEHEQNLFPSLAYDVKIVEPTPISVPPHLKAYTHDKGDIQSFESPSPDPSGKFDYYLMDASSILPILALDLEPGCNVLDVCAAPGGKTLAMLQTMLPDKVVCLDHSHRRIMRLRDVVRQYTPLSYYKEQRVEIIHGDSLKVVRKREFQQQFDRVLVDAPCFTDRHVVHVEDNNIFRPSRIKDRLKIQELQQQLLVAGIESCKPGGTIVYSTCTLSPPQNDGVISSVVEYLWENSNIDVVVEDTSSYREAFQDTFSFYSGCRFGQLVVPNILSNFGPFYFCKLKRAA